MVISSISLVWHEDQAPNQVEYCCFHFSGSKFKVCAFIIVLLEKCNSVSYLLKISENQCSANAISEFDAALNAQQNKQVLVPILPNTQAACYLTNFETSSVILVKRCSLLFNQNLVLCGFFFFFLIFTVILTNLQIVHRRHAQSH